MRLWCNARAQLNPRYPKIITKIKWSKPVIINHKNPNDGREIPCLGGALKMFCISPRMEMSWITQWSFQCPAILMSSTSSFASSRSTITGFLPLPLRLLVGLDCSVTHSWGARFLVSSVRSMVAFGMTRVGDVNAGPDDAGIKGWGNTYGIWFPIWWNPWKNGTWGMPGRTVKPSCAPKAGGVPFGAFTYSLVGSRAFPWKSMADKSPKHKKFMAM